MDKKIEKFDLAIVGASIAGNFLCYLLSNTKLRIIVIEEHTEIGVPFQCAGIVSQKLTQLINVPKDIILNRVSVAKIVAPFGKFIKLSGDEKPYIINRIALDRLFYEKVKNNKNISFCLGEKFEYFKYIKENRKKCVLLETSKRNIKVKMLIGCDGPLSLVGKTLGIKNKVIYASQIRIKGTFSQYEAAMYFDPRWKELFGWIVPEGNNIYRIGMGASTNIGKKFKLFVKGLKIALNQKIDQQGGLIPYGMMNKIAFNNILLLGDSACQVKATTGGGIVMLLTCAKYSARCIVKCFKTNNFSKKFIKKNYEKLCASTIGRQLKIHYIIRSMLENFSNKDFEKLFKIIKTSNIKHLISFYGDMDFPRDLIFKLLKNPLVITFLIKFGLKHPNIFIKLLKTLIK